MNIYFICAHIVTKETLVFDYVPFFSFYVNTLFHINKTFPANNLFISPFVRVFSQTVIKISFLEKSVISTRYRQQYYHYEVLGCNLNYYENRMDTVEHITECESGKSTLN